MRDGFLSYASEDINTATQLFDGLAKYGFDIWYAPVSLKVGQRLLDSIERGMKESRFGILLLSKAYFSKGWTSYEIDTLLRSFIEKNKKLLPLWLDVDVHEIAEYHSGLAGIVALKIDSNIAAVVQKLATELSENSPTIGVMPSWESPKHRFLQGRGEILLGSAQGPASSLWEFLLHAADSDYPLFLGGEKLSKEYLLWRAAELLAQTPEVTKGWVTAAEVERIWALCKNAGIDPQILG